MTKHPPQTSPAKVSGFGLLSILLAAALAFFASPAEAQAPASPGVCAVTNAEAGAFVFWEAVDGATEYVYGARYNDGPQRFDRTSESSLFIDAEAGRITALRVAAITNGVTSNAIDCIIDGQGGPEQPPVTQPPVTQPPVTQPPVTQPPVTEPPVTEPPVTEPPVVDPPTDEPPVIEPPVIEPPVVEPPVEEPPAEEEPAEPEGPDDEADNGEDSDKDSDDKDSDDDEADDDDGRRGNSGNRCNAAERGRSGANDNMGNRCNAERRGNSANAGTNANRPADQANNGNRCNEQQRGNSGNNANNGNRCNVEERGNSAQAAREGLARSGRPCHAVAGGNGVGIAWNPMPEAAEYVFAYRVNGLTRYDRANANAAVIQGLPEGAQVALRVGSVRADGSYGAAVDCGEVEAPAEAAE